MPNAKGYTSDILRGRNCRPKSSRPLAGGAGVITRVQRWGNSQGLRLSKELLAEAGIDVGDTVHVAVRDDGVLVISPARRVRGVLDLNELVAGIPHDYRPHEVEWGPAAGDEVW